VASFIHAEFGPYGSLWRLPMGSKPFARNDCKIFVRVQEYQAGGVWELEQKFPPAADCWLMAI